MCEARDMCGEFMTRWLDKRATCQTERSNGSETRYERPNYPRYVNECQIEVQARQKNKRWEIKDYAPRWKFLTLKHKTIEIKCE